MFCKELTLSKAFSCKRCFPRTAQCMHTGSLIFSRQFLLPNYLDVRCQIKLLCEWKRIILKWTAKCILLEECINKCIQLQIFRHRNYGSFCQKLVNAQLIVGQSIFGYLIRHNSVCNLSPKMERKKLRTNSNKLQCLTNVKTVSSHVLASFLSLSISLCFAHSSSISLCCACRCQKQTSFQLTHN